MTPSSQQTPHPPVGLPSQSREGHDCDDTGYTAPTCSDPSENLSGDADISRMMALAADYIDLVKTRFSHVPHVYKNFLKLFVNFGAGETDISELCRRVSLLCDGHPDLVQGLNQFLPANYHVMGEGESTNASTTTTLHVPGAVLVSTQPENQNSGNNPGAVDHVHHFQSG